MKRVMIDIETLGRNPGCVILSIGAVIFDEDGPSTHQDDSFYAVIDWLESIRLGFDVDNETKQWWDKQSPKAKQEVFFNPMAVPPSQALSRFSEWLHERQPEEFWANDPQFDLSILDKSLAWAGRMPVSAGEYWKESAFRTQMRNTPALYEEYRQGKAPSHIAIEDATWQAFWAARSITLVQDALALYYPPALKTTEDVIS